MALNSRWRPSQNDNREGPGSEMGFSEKGRKLRKTSEKALRLQRSVGKSIVLAKNLSLLILESFPRNISWELFIEETFPVKEVGKNVWSFMGSRGYAWIDVFIKKKWFEVRKRALVGPLTFIIYVFHSCGKRKTSLNKVNNFSSIVNGFSRLWKQRIYTRIINTITRL